MPYLAFPPGDSGAARLDPRIDVLVVCPGCSARYRIDQDRVPPQGARARCPKCERVFRLGWPLEAAAVPEGAGAGAAGAAAARSGSPGRPPGPAAPDPFSTLDDSRPRPAVLAARIRLARQSGAERPLLVSHGFGIGGGAPGQGGAEAPGAPSDALLALTDEDVRQIAEDLVTALAAHHAGRVAEARADQRWDAHLGGVIREAWSDFQACVGTTQATDDHFRAALNRILADGRPVF